VGFEKAQQVVGSAAGAEGNDDPDRAAWVASLPEGALRHSNGCEGGGWQRPAVEYRHPRLLPYIGSS
jgi:hypothetical protein